MDTTDARTVAATYFRAWKDRDFATLRAILADDVSFRGPLATLDNADDCVEGLRGMAEMTTPVWQHRANTLELLK
jgi:ketosteroid isomerase-like protein